MLRQWRGRGVEPVAEMTDTVRHAALLTIWTVDLVRTGQLHNLYMSTGVFEQPNIITSTKPRPPYIKAKYLHTQVLCTCVESGSQRINTPDFGQLP